MTENIINNYAKRSSDVLESESVEKAYIAIKAVIASLSKTVEADVVTQFNEIIATFGVDPLNTFQCADKHRHKLIHLLVNWNKPEVIRALGGILALNEQRPKDGCTPLHLSAWTKNFELTQLLLDLGADPSIRNSYGEDCTQLAKLTTELPNIAFLDLELTALPSDVNAKIIEMAVVVTNSQLEELERKQWVITTPEGELQVMSAWAQKTFSAVDQGGNGLLADIIVSTTSAAEAESDLLALLKRHCLEKRSPLAGFSVHCDREVLKHQMPAIYNFMSHQVLDVSTVLSLARRWTPLKLAGMPTAETTAHRAMNDVERSIEVLSFLKGSIFLST